MRTRLTDLPDDPRHGTRNGYYHHKCRCERCRAACAAYQAKRQYATKAWADLKAWNAKHGVGRES